MSLPPGPTSHPLIQTIRWIREPFPFLDECQARYGDVFTLRVPGIGELVLVSHPEPVKELFSLGSDDFSAAKANAVLRPFLGDHSMLLLDRREHMRHRKMMMPSFHGERMSAYGRTMLEITDASIDTWPMSRSFPIHHPMQDITLRVILRTVFGIAEGARSDEFARLLTASLDLIAWPPLLFPPMHRDLGPLSPWGKFVRIRNKITAILLDEIRRGRERGVEGRTDILALLLSARDEDGKPLSDEELHDELITLLVAGHETTATALAWAFRWILATQGLADRMTDEISRVCPSGELVPEKLAKLELLDHVVRETLRLQPVIPLVGRAVDEPTNVLGYEVPAGVVIAPSIYLLHRRGATYPHPHKFDPDRFLSSKPSPSEWLPFGGGLRKCIGAAFALYEMKMVLATVVMRTRMKLVNKRVDVVRRSITLTPSEGMPVELTERRGRWRANAAE